MLPSRRMIIAALIIVLINLAMMMVLAQVHWFGRVIGLVGMIFVGMAIFVRKDAARTPIWFVLLVTLAIQLPELIFLPRTSDDAYRYVWDGRVLLAGIDPLPIRPTGSRLGTPARPVALPGRGAATDQPAQGADDLSADCSALVCASVSWCSASCPATGRRRATTEAAASPCSAGCLRTGACRSRCCWRSLARWWPSCAPHGNTYS